MWNGTNASEWLLEASSRNGTHPEQWRCIRVSWFKTTEEITEDGCDCRRGMVQIQAMETENARHLSGWYQTQPSSRCWRWSSVWGGPRGSSPSTSKWAGLNVAGDWGDKDQKAAWSHSTVGIQKRFGGFFDLLVGSCITVWPHMQRQNENGERDERFKRAGSGWYVPWWGFKFLAPK